MGNRNETRIVLSTLRYKSAPEVDSYYPIGLSQNSKNLIEFERTVDVNLAQLFDDERQFSQTFRPASKFTVLFKNSYVGKTNYPPFENNLYYVNQNEAILASCPPNPSVAWTGYPQYNEFDFIRTDTNVSGYTQPPNQHLIFKPISASSYNWNFYVSYAYRNDTNKNLFLLTKNGTPINWKCSDGIPFVIELGNDRGINIISFRCPIKHGLSQGEFVELSINYNGDKIFQVDSLGNGIYGNDEYVFNLINPGYTGTTFNSNVIGTAKRIILETNTGDTKSEYYVRQHKILTNISDGVLVRCGFEQNIFGVNKKYESAGYTPNSTARVSILEGAQSYSFSLNKDIDALTLLDNQQKPISELFFTVTWGGYFGWTKGLKQGWDFNLPLNPITRTPNIWWDTTNASATASTTTIQTGTYTTPLSSNPFIYNQPLKEGDIIDGDLCEWNDYEQKERVISKIQHKITFNSQHFNTSPANPNNPLGYYYCPHYPLKIRQYTPYIEEGAIDVVDIPNYAYYSTTKQNFIWREIYPYGYIDDESVGVNFPFLNGKHYPYREIIFRIIPEGTNYIDNNIVAEPTTDDCE